MITYEYVGFCMWEKPKFSRYTWPYQSYHVVFWQADQSQPWLRLFKVTKLHWDGVGWVWAAMQKKQPFLLRWGVCFPPWFDAFLCHSWNWSRYRESSMGRGCSLSLITGVYSVYWTSLLVSDRVLFGLDHSHSLLFLLPFFRIGCAFICHFSTTWSRKFWTI